MSSPVQKPTNKPLNERAYWFLAERIPSGAGWMLDGRWQWQRRLGRWWLKWWGWAFFYAKPWRPGSFDDR